MRLSEAVNQERDRTKQVVAVGSGALDITQYWAQPVVTQEVTTIFESIDRSKRLVSAEQVEDVEMGRSFIDDVAVTGATLDAALVAASYTPEDEVVVGMAFESKRLLGRVPLPLKAAVRYRQSGGGTPSVNSLSTLIQRPEVADDYARRKQLSPLLMSTVKRLYEGETI